jgi:hypothetical protein
VRFITFETLVTGVRAFECAFSVRTSSFVHGLMTRRAAKRAAFHQKASRARGKGEDVGLSADQPATIGLHQFAPPLGRCLALVVAGDARDHMGERKLGQLPRKVGLFAAPVAEYRSPAMRRPGLDPRLLGPIYVDFLRLIVFDFRGAPIVPLKPACSHAASIVSLGKAGKRFQTASTAFLLLVTDPSRSLKAAAISARERSS